MNPVLKTSEFWMALLSAVLGALQTQGVIQPAMAGAVNTILGGLVAYVIGRVTHKVVNGATPFMPKK